MAGCMMSQSVADKYFRQILEALNECEVVLQESLRVAANTKNSRRRWVSVDGMNQDNKIYIRSCPNRVNMVLTLIHEALHHVFQEIPEYESIGEAIDLLSYQLFCRFSTRQLEQLAYYLKH